MIIEAFIQSCFQIKSSFNFILFSRAGAGSHYGTFSGAISAFSPNVRPRKAFAPTGRNFLINPAKKGTGYGYVNVLIGKPTTYSSEQYDKAKELYRVRLKLANLQRYFKLIGSNFVGRGGRHQ